MHRRKIIFATLCLCSLSISAHARQDDTVGYATVSEALAALKADPDARITQKRGWTIVRQAQGDDRILWSFTPKGHPAYPAMIKRMLHEEKDGMSIKMVTLCTAGKAACDRLIKDATNENKRIARDSKATR